MSLNIEECVRESLKAYFTDLEGESPANVYSMVLTLVEKPMLQEVMLHAEHNQSKAAEWLGLNRNTLRKKLIEHDLLESKQDKG